MLVVVGSVSESAGLLGLQGLQKISCEHQFSGWKYLVEVRREWPESLKADLRATVTQSITCYKQAMQKSIPESTTHLTFLTLYLFQVNLWQCVTVFARTYIFEKSQSNLIENANPILDSIQESQWSTAVTDKSTNCFDSKVCVVPVAVCIRMSRISNVGSEMCYWFENCNNSSENNFSAVKIVPKRSRKTAIRASVSSQACTVS